MKITRDTDDLIVRYSDFDWGEFIRDFDWTRFYHDYSDMHLDDSKASGEEFSYPTQNDGYRVVALDVPITNQEMRRIREKCAARHCHLGSFYYVARLIDDMLFIASTHVHQCDAVIRFEKSDRGFSAVEYIEEVDERFSPVFTSGVVLEMFDCLFVDDHFHWLDDDNWDLGWVWYEEGEEEGEDVPDMIRTWGLY